MWENNTESTLIMKKISLLEKDINLRKRLIEKAEDLEVLNEFLDQEQVKEEEVSKELDIFSKLLKDFELKLILNGKNDSNDAIVTIHPGAGGTESQDWADPCRSSKPGCAPIPTPQSCACCIVCCITSGSPA